MKRKVLIVLVLSFLFSLFIANCFTVHAGPPALDGPAIVGNEPEDQTFEGVSLENYIPEVDVDVYGVNPFDVAIFKYLQYEDNPPISYTVNYIPEGLYRIPNTYYFYYFSDVVEMDDQDFSSYYTIKTGENLEGLFLANSYVYTDYQYDFVIGDQYYKWSSTHHDVYAIYDEFVEVVFVLAYPDVQQPEINETDLGDDLQFEDYNDRTDEYFFASLAHLELWVLFHSGAEWHTETIYNGFRIYVTYGNDLIAIMQVQVTVNPEDVISWGLDNFGGGSNPCWFDSLAD